MVTSIYTECWGNIKKTVLLFTILPLFWKSGTDGACTKFATHANFAKAVEVGGTCFYTFYNELQYSDAETLCSDEGMRLVHFEDETKQLDVWTALGFDYRYHWMGLKNVSGSWQWWDAITGSGSVMTSARWEGQSSGQCAMTFNTNMGGKWAAENLDDWHQPVCEDATAEMTSLIPTSPATAEATSQSTADNTTGCKVSDIADSGTKMMWFKKAETIRSVEVTAEMAVVSKLDCARRCLSAAFCCSFSFNTVEKTCRHFRFVESGIDATCTSPASCFTFY